MVPSQERDAIRVAKLQARQYRDRLNREGTAVNIIPQKEIVRVRNMPANPEELQEVVNLAMNISNDCHWRRHGLDIALSDENQLQALAEGLCGAWVEMLTVKRLLDRPIDVKGHSAPLVLSAPVLTPEMAREWRIHAGRLTLAPTTNTTET